MCELNEAIEEATNFENVKALIFMAKDPDFFCSGGDLDTVREIFNHEDGSKMAALMHDTMMKLTVAPMITATLVRGRAIGGGAELTLASDFRIFSPTGNLSFVHGKMGVATGFGGGARLARIVGKRIALKLMLSGSRIDAQEAQKLGLCDHIINGNDNKEAIEESKVWIDNLVGHLDPSVISGIKRIGSIPEVRDLASDLEQEREYFTQLWSAEAHKTAMGKNIKH